MARHVDRDAKKRRILDAAARVFARKGFYNTRISEIAEAAGVADGTIYIYFEGKDELLINIFEEQMEFIIKRFREKLATTHDPEERMKVFVEEHFKLAEEFPDHAGVITIELRQSNKFMKEYRNEKFKEYLSLIEDIIEYGKLRGRIPKDLNTVFTARAVFGLLDELTLMWSLAKSRPSIDELVSSAWGLISRGLFGHEEAS